MIRFSCRCSQVVELSDDMAGLSTQCPKCGLLLDVPTLSDAGAIDADGTYRLDNRPTPKINEHLQELTTVYFPGRHRSDGTDIDLRGTVGPAKPPPEPAPPAQAAAPPTPNQRPKYDPETGELLVPVDINQPAVAIDYSNLPTARRVIEYSATTHRAHPFIPDLGVFTHLLEPVNLIVLGVMFVMHLALILFAIVSSYIIVIYFAPIALVVLLIGHYAMLVEEMGPNERDELPRPLRNVHFYDDFVAPFVHMVSSLLLCYWPSFIIIFANLTAAANNNPFPFPHTRDLHLAIFLIGSLAFPATLQTICTSGNILNLRPDRIWGIIRCTSLRYLPIVLLWIVAITSCLAGQWAVAFYWASLFIPKSPPLPLIAQPFIAYPLLILGIYLLHAFGWVLGQEYQRSHPFYPWILQQHIRTTEPVQEPILHPKLSAAEQAAQQRAAKRAKSQIR